MNRLLLFGNPNVGKTSIFNALTDSNERVGNFEGVTLKEKVGKIKNHDYELVDIPGTNTLSGESLVEKTATNILLKDDYSQIINVTDITNLKRNLYLLLDLLETGRQVDVVINMMDIFSGEFDALKFADKFNVNVVISNKEKSDINIDKLIAPRENNFKIKYSDDVESALVMLSGLINNKDNTLNKRFVGIQFLKGNKQVTSLFADIEQAEKLRKELENKIINDNISKSLGGYFFLEKRKFINEVMPEIIKNESVNNELKWLNEKFDKIALHKFWGYVLFILIMYLVFAITYKGTILQDIVDKYVQMFSVFIDTTLTSYHVAKPIISFVTGGIIAGVGGVLVFLPQIIIMFTLLTVLEATGYFSRVTVLFENLFNKIGLSAHSVIPYISGLGCNVIGIMSTRTIKDETKRITTIMTSPFISCSARLPIYLIFVDIFFAKHKALVLLFLYLLGITIAIIVAYVLDKVLGGKSSKMKIFTLPKYKKISWQYLGRMVKVKVLNFINNAGKFIFVGSIVIWLLAFLGPNGYTENIDASFAGLLANNIKFIFAPLGFGTTQASASLLSAFLAKELAISSMMVMYGANSTATLSGILATHYNVASAMSFMVFSLLYVPCFSTLGAIYSELGRKRYVFYAVVLSLSVGYSVAFVVYHIMLLFV